MRGVCRKKARIFVFGIIFFGTAALLSGRVSLRADDRLSEFSGLVKDINAEAPAPVKKETRENVSGNHHGNAPAGSSLSGNKLSDNTAGAGKTRKETDSGDRLSDFASLVKDTEEKAGITDSDPQSDRVIRTGEGGGDPDGRLTAMAREVSRIEKEMEKKYGPVIEDKVISNPGEYNDGDRVVATENTKSESLVRLKGVRFDRINSSRKNTKDIFELKGDELQSTLGNFNNNKEEQVSEKFEGSGDTDFSLDSLLGSKGRSLGIFRLTAYDACIICCGKTDGITATGTKAEVGRTIAVDPNVIPFGTRVMIDGHIYTAEDSGSKIKGNRIDVFLSTHEEARRFGVKEAEVFLVE